MALASVGRCGFHNILRMVDMGVLFTGALENSTESFSGLLGYL